MDDAFAVDFAESAGDLPFSLASSLALAFSSFSFSFSSFFCRSFSFFSQRQPMATELARALAAGGFAVTLASGGMPLRDMVDEPFAFVQLPPVKVEGLEGSRFTVACNGHAMPLQPTGTRGERVAGVRFRAWQPPSALHPTIGVHAPLTVDLVDTWAQRSLGGGRYHVAHPGGRNYSTFPVNAYEAESRHLARFSRMGHTPGKVAAALAPASLDYPFTLDLRRQAG